MTPPSGSAAHVYLRMSEDRTREEAGHDRQLADCRALAASLGVTVAAVHTDTESATTGAVRPGFEALLKARPRLIIAWHEDRLLRTNKDLERVIDLDGAVHFVTHGRLDLATPTGRAVARTVTAWSHHEAEHKAQRQRLANKQRAERGEPWRGNVRLFGYTLAFDLVPAEAERAAEAYAAVLAGTSLRALAARWAAAGVVNVSGQPFNSRRLVEVLRRPIYAGRRHYRGEDIGPCTAPAVVDLDTFAAVQVILNDPSRRTTDKGGRGPLCLLSGVARCGRCEGPMTAGVGTANSAAHTRYRTLTCRGCLGLSRKEEPIEEFVTAVVLARMRRPDFAELLEAPAPDLAPLRARAGELRAQRDELAADLTVDLSFAAKRDARLRAELEKVETEIADRSRGGALAPFAGGRDPGEVWQALDLVGRRAVVRELIDVVILPVPRGARVFDPDSLTIDWKI